MNTDPATQLVEGRRYWLPFHAPSGWESADGRRSGDFIGTINGRAAFSGRTNDPIYGPLDAQYAPVDEGTEQ